MILHELAHQSVAVGGRCKDSIFGANNAADDVEKSYDEDVVAIGTCSIET